MAFEKIIIDDDGKEFRLTYFKEDDNIGKFQVRIIKLETRLNSKSEWNNVYEGILEYTNPNIFDRISIRK
jgi:hypothetical protein